MKIELREITVGQLAEGYKDSGAEGVVGFGGRLNIRPPYQREFIYKDRQRDAVVTTITQNFPLNVMYWADCGNNTYEVIDGQQRTISICQYVAGEFAYMFRYFHNLTPDEQQQILAPIWSIPGNAAPAAPPVRPLPCGKPIWARPSPAPLLPEASRVP